MKVAKLEAEPVRTRARFGSGLEGDDTSESSEPVGTRGPALKVSVYPWGTEFEIVPGEAGHEGEE